MSIFKDNKENFISMEWEYKIDIADIFNCSPALTSLKNDNKDLRNNFPNIMFDCFEKQIGEQIDNIDPLRVRNSSFTKDTDLAGNADNECSNEPNNDTSSVDACVDDDQVSEQSIIKKSQDGVCSSDDCTSLSPQYDQFEGCQIMEDISKCNRDYNIIVDTLIDCDFGQKNLRQWKNASKDVINEILLIKQSKGKLSKHDKKSLMDKYDLTDKKIKNIIKNHQSKRRLN